MTDYDAQAKRKPKKVEFVFDERSLVGPEEASKLVSTPGYAKINDTEYIEVWAYLQLKAQLETAHAALRQAAEAERARVVEMCVAICDGKNRQRVDEFSDGYNDACDDIAAAIRAAGK